MATRVLSPRPRESAVAVDEEIRVISWLMEGKDHLLLEPVSWDCYQGLLAARGARPLRHAYDRGRMEIVTRSSRHEIFKTLLGAMVVVLAEELKRPLQLGGETTLLREDLARGLEPDNCFWVQSAHRVRGKLDLDFATDPPPDLFLEIEVSHTLLDRLSILAALRVPEVWRYDGKVVDIGILSDSGEYQWGQASRCFPGIPIAELARFLDLAGALDHLGILAQVRQWVREQRNPAE